jgi:cytochrome b pre-mRNA-processing protein 3
MGLLQRLFGLAPSPAAAQASELLAWVVDISRAPGFFGAGRAADTFDGRLELVMAHAAVLTLRLRRDPKDAAVAQQFVDQFFRYLDASLREDGVGDLSVPKRMKKLAGAFYGRLQAYESGLVAAEPGALAAALRRNALDPDAEAFAQPLAQHLLSLAATLESTALGAVAALSIALPDTRSAA